MHEDSPHMLREIYEQPAAIRATLAQHWDNTCAGIHFDRTSLTSEPLRDCRRIVIAASGASRHAGLFAQLLIEDLVGIPVTVEHASEFSNRRVARGEGSLAVVITQSGETADTASAQRVAKEAGYRTIAITNVADSTIGNNADAVLYTCAGTELAIPATKSFTAQLAALTLLTLKLAHARQKSRDAAVVRCARSLSGIADLLETELPRFDFAAEAIAAKLGMNDEWILLGRGVHYAIVLEGALKLKETAYLRAEALPAGEFRHGPLAVLDGTQVVLGIVSHDRNDPMSVARYRKSMEVLDDISAMAGHLVLLTTAEDALPHGKPTHIPIPVESEPMLALLETVPLQLLAYHIARHRGLDVDHPRNLVKSVPAD